MTTSIKKTPAKKAVTKKMAAKTNQKDRTKLIFKGKQYGKGRVVQAIIEKYVEDHPGITSKQLNEAFPNNLHALGLIQPVTTAKKKSTNHRRYFLKEPIQLKDKKVVVCSEFGTGNISPFLEKATEYGYTVKKSRRH